MLTDFAHYRLPDGTVVEARQASSIPRTWRLDTLDGQPVYLQEEARPHRWLRLVYNAATDAYEASPSDLALADLTPAE
jgi:predicted component of type VI protein secretion system